MFIFSSLGHISYYIDSFQSVVSTSFHNINQTWVEFKTQSHIYMSGDNKDGYCSRCKFSPAGVYDWEGHRAVDQVGVHWCSCGGRMERLVSRSGSFRSGKRGFSAGRSNYTIVDIEHLLEPIYHDIPISCAEWDLMAEHHSRLCSTSNK